MKKILILGLLATCMVYGQDSVKILPLTPVNPDKVLTEEAKNQPHVCFVNVGQAVAPELFREMVAGITLILPVHLATAVADDFDGQNLFERSGGGSRFGRNAKLVIYVVNKPGLVSFINVPARWALINLHGLDRDKPDQERYRRRLRQMALKGLAHACGAGASPDTRCVMYYGSFTLDGIDKTSVSYSPFVHDPVQRILLAVGGEKIFPAPQ